MPPLSPVIEKLEDVAEPLRSSYESRDGKYHLSLSGAPTGFVSANDLAAANLKVVEFRDNNLRLIAESDAVKVLKESFKDLDPAAARAAIAAQAALASKGIKNADDIQSMITAAVIAAVKPVQDQLLALNTTHQQTTETNNALLMRTAIGERFAKAGGVTDALDYILGKAKGTFIVENGVVKAAPTMFSADKPGELVSIEEWLTKQTKESSFAFKPSGGGGAAPVVPGASGGTLLRPGQIILKDPTPQQLGQFAEQIRKGEVKVVDSQAATL